jgi:hypothetical protein
MGPGSVRVELTANKEAKASPLPGTTSNPMDSRGLGTVSSPGRPTRSLLSQMAQLAEDVMRSSEEKVNVAQNTCDLVRFVKHHSIHFRAKLIST